MMGWSHYGQEIQLEEFDAGAFLRSRQQPVVLDVGCGMSYATGNYLSAGGRLQPLDIHYVDPLASYFNDILRRYKRDLPEIEFGMMEYLSAFYPSGHADLVVIQNALDHSAKPLKGIVEALHILKPGGILYLNHHADEAEREHYKGFHKYNINQADGHLTIWNKDSKHDVNQLLEGFAEVQLAPARRRATSSPSSARPPRCPLASCLHATRRRCCSR